MLKINKNKGILRQQPKMSLARIVHYQQSVDAFR